MNDPRIETWVRTLVTYSTAVQPGDVVAITGEVAARPLYQALYRETLRAGGLPVVIPRLDEAPADLLRLASDEQLAWISPVDRWIYGEATSTSASKRRRTQKRSRASPRSDKSSGGDTPESSSAASWSGRPPGMCAA